ncbi:hypothetical protein Cgig2_000777 [Carnegiea gigantea]|uniref:Uncharacterized protein n=1 Tax=Carnegiea gigantea TaxID=171969 RepID=A0A9Q1KQ17_9CARY|nr:hypothetical protein Cgig2_000777 [Carnegiea gigantea]
MVLLVFPALSRPTPPLTSSCLTDVSYLIEFAAVLIRLSAILHLPRLLCSFSICPSSCVNLPFACFAASKRLIGSFSLSLYDSLQLPRFFVPFTVQVSEFDASHTFYFLVDQFVKVRVYRVLALVNHCYKIFDESNSELTFEVGTYGVTWVEQVAFARPLSNGHRFRESKGGAQPSGFMSVVSAIDRISVSPELLQPSYSYGPQVRMIVLLCSLLAAGYGKDVFFEVVNSLCCSAS